MLTGSAGTGVERVRFGSAVPKEEAMACRWRRGGEWTRTTKATTMREGSESLWQLRSAGALHVRRRERAPGQADNAGLPIWRRRALGRMARELGPLRPRPRKPSLHWPVGRASTRRGATLTLVAPASESPLAFIVVAAGSSSSSSK